MMVPVASDRVPSATLLKSLFDLTPSEARVASGIARGETPDSIAASGQVAISPVLSQIRRVLEKPGTSRQSDLAGLLARLGATAPNYPKKLRTIPHLQDEQRHGSGSLLTHRRHNTTTT